MLESIRVTPFALTEEQQMLAESLQRLLQNSNEFSVRRARLSREVPDRMALWPALAEQGVLAAAFDEAQGGFAGDARTIAVIMSELGRALAIEPFLATAVVVGRILRHWSDTAARQAAIDSIIAGRDICVLVHNAFGDPFAGPCIEANTSSGTITLSGSVPAVRHAELANVFLVPAWSAGEIEIYRIARDAIGLRVEPYRLMDAAAAADVHFDQLRLPPSSRLSFDTAARDILDEALEWGILGLGAESVGIVGALNAATFTYLMARKQFGAPLGTFQALQHRSADMWIAAEEALAMVDLAIESISSTERPARESIVSAMKVVADNAGRRVASEAVQLHGGMGVSDELIVSHYFRRLATIRGELGSADAHRLRFSSKGMNVRADDANLLHESPDLRSWREDVRHFVRTHLPPDLGQKVEQGLKLQKDDYVRWQKILLTHNRFAGAWPRQYGGQGWNLHKQRIFSQEAALQNAPMIIPYGVNMVGPVLYTFGNASQQREHLPGILSSDVWWCQGYSEPGSGSDLASLKTSAVRDGDCYVVNGTKMWTTEAHWADMMHCLVRTNRDTKPQQGISFLLIDMKTPGITVTPIVTIDGIHHTNQIFLDDVRVPVGNLVGTEGQGWTIAKFLLGNERTSIADTGPKMRLLRHLRKLHAVSESEPAVSTSTRPCSPRNSQISKSSCWPCASSSIAMSVPGPRESAGSGSVPAQDSRHRDIAGTDGAGVGTRGALGRCARSCRLYRDPALPSNRARRASVIAHEYLYARCWSIFGGTNEIQRNIIARQILAS